MAILSLGVTNQSTVAAMGGDFSSITSNQHGVHKNLNKVVQRHREHVFQKPIAEHTRHAFVQLQAELNTHSRPLVLDSGCGVGESTRHLGQRHPDCWVIGVDKSEQRLSHQGLSRRDGFASCSHDSSVVANRSLLVTRHDNCLWVRADLIDFWRLASTAGWRLQHHYLLYPNPWPKAEHLQRRWHGHPVFPTLIALGGRLEARSNWSVYIDELACALKLFQVNPINVEAWVPSSYITPFERKYFERGERLYRLCAGLP